MRSKPERPSRETLAKLVKQGLTRQQIAGRLGMNCFRAVHFLKIYGLKPVRQRWGSGRK